MSTTTLDESPDHIKLAVDLIQILEEAKIAPDTAILALDIVLKDMHSKLQQENKT